MKDKNYSVAIIGAGNIGIRHLQGLSQSRNFLKIYVVDTNQSSLDRAKKHYLEFARESKMIPSYISDITLLPKEIELVIISTNADVRRVVAENILRKKYST